MHYFERENNCLVWRNYGETLKIAPWGDNGFRVQSAIMREPEYTEYALLPIENKAQPVFHIEKTTATIQNGKLKAQITQDNWREYAQLTFLNQNDEVLLKELSCGGALALKARHFKPLLGGDHSLTVTLESTEDERLYGMGQYQQEILNLKNCSLELAHRNSQASVPFVISSLGYGFLWHNPAIGDVHFSKNKTIWHAQSTKQMDYYITCGDTPGEISLNYAKVTGFAPMMPEYGLGFWQCKLRYWNQNQLLEVAREYKKRKLPIDVIVCDFFHWPKMGDFRFDPEFFPDPEAMVNELESMGIKLMVSVWPQIALDSENYKEMRQKGLLVRSELGEQIGMRFGGDSMFYDVTNPKARDYVWQKCKKNYYNKGVRIFWLDEAEPEYSTYDFENYRYFLGSNQQIGNVYPQLFSRNFFEGMMESGQEGIVNLVRCAWAGSQRYGALVWSGDVHSDWSTFRKQLCAGLSMGIAGIPWWTTDIGGFHGGDPADERFCELLIRWFQWGAYCPVMRLHGDRQPSSDVLRKDGTKALPTGNDNEIWSYGEAAYQIMRKYLTVRESMRDYIRQTMEETHRTGKPVIRAMCYEFPGDGVCEALNDQYMFGGRYLVAPVMYAGMTERNVYLPIGAQWRNIETNMVYSGGETVLAQAPLEVIPVFERMEV